MRLVHANRLIIFDESARVQILLRSQLALGLAGRQWHAAFFVDCEGDDSARVLCVGSRRSGIVCELLLDNGRPIGYIDSENRHLAWEHIEIDLNAKKIESAQNSGKLRCRSELGLMSRRWTLQYFFADISVFRKEEWRSLGQRRQLKMFFKIRMCWLYLM